MHLLTFKSVPSTTGGLSEVCCEITSRSLKSMFLIEIFSGVFTAVS
jgi:hypothetical protein